MECRRCEREFTASRIPCKNTHPGCCLAFREREIPEFYCVQCCRERWPNATRSHTPSQHPTYARDGYVHCNTCGNDRVGSYCNCCRVSSTHGFCRTCCTALKHLCCGFDAGAERVLFRPAVIPPIFAYPSSKTYPNPAFISAEESLAILGRLASRSLVNSSGFSQNNSRRFAAVELEISDYKDGKEINAVMSKWGCAVVHDGSIMSAKGFEVNTTPACGNALRQELKEICDALVTADATVTDHCGVHVHVDCRDFGYQEVQKFAKVYAIIEPLLFAGVHYTRRDSDYCTPCGEKFFKRYVKGIKPDTKTLKKAFIGGVYGDKSINRGEFRTYRKDHYGRVGGTRNPVRYSAVNLHSYFLRGTIEFRLHHGAVDFVEVYGWAKFLVDLFDSIYKIPDKELTGLLTQVQPLSALSRGSELLESLLPSSSASYLTKKVLLQERCGEVLPAQLLRKGRLKVLGGITLDDNFQIQEVV